MPTPSDDPSTADFEAHRRSLRALAYRMLGSRAEAEDVVQDCWLRWREVDRSTVRDARAYLSQTATHLCLDRLQSARTRREVAIAGAQRIGTGVARGDEDIGAPVLEIEPEAAVEAVVARIVAECVAVSG